MFCLQPLVVLRDLEAHEFAVLQTTPSGTLDVAVMHENLTAAVANDEAESFRAVEPFDAAGFAIVVRVVSGRRASKPPSSSAARIDAREDADASRGCR